MPEKYFHIKVDIFPEASFYLLLLSSVKGGRPKAALVGSRRTSLGGRPKAALADARLILAFSFSSPVASSDLFQ